MPCDWRGAFSVRPFACFAPLIDRGLAPTLRRNERAKVAIDLEVARLERALQIAATANQAKSRYLASVSHEIRSPLNVIYGYAQLIERGGITAQEAARVIRRSTEHLTRLVEGLLDMSQVENGVLRLRIESVDLGAFMDSLVAMMRPAAQAKGLELRYDPPKWMPTLVNMDQSRLQQVLINLLSNAIKFTDHGHVTLKLHYSSQIASFEIIDTGPGIAAADQERIFEAFERSDHAEARGQHGVGLGLTISRAIIAILGGQLELDSDPGAGSCFRIKMMLGETVGQAVPLSRLPRIVVPSRCKSILIVDDDADQLALLERLLSSLDLSVVAVDSGAAALTQCADQRFDLAILDVSLGDMSGWGLADRLRATAGEDLRIMMLTANAHELHRLDFSHASHDFFLLKPFDFDVLTSAVANLLRLPPSAGVSKPETPATLKSPDRAPLPKEALVHVVRIRELLRIGYIRGIATEIEQLAARGPEAGELIDRLYGCLDRFDLAGMQKALERL